MHQNNTKPLNLYSFEGTGPFLLVLAAAFLIRLFYFRGIDGADDISLAFSALQYLESGYYIPTNHYNLRIGLTMPLALVFGIAGVGAWQLALFPLIYSLSSVWLAWAIGRRAAGSAAGLLAALALALFPLDVQASTVLFPDIPLGTTMALAVYLVLRGFESARPVPWTLAAGAVWGFAYLIKIEAGLLGFVMLVLMAQNRQKWPIVAGAMAVAATVVLAENVIYFIQTNKIFYHLSMVAATNAVMDEWYSRAQLWVFPKQWFVTFYDFALYYYFLFAALAWALATRRWALLPHVAWVAVFLLWLEFGGNPFSEHYAPKTHLSRYCSYLSVPMTVLIGSFLAQAQLFGSRLRLTVGVLALVVPALFFLNFSSLNNERQAATLRALEVAVARKAFPLYLDKGSYDLAEFLLYDRPERAQIQPAQIHDFATGKTRLVDLDRATGFLLINRAFMEHRQNRYFMTPLDAEDLKSRHELVYAVDNPGNALAYLQTRLLAAVANLLPIPFLRDTIARTAQDILVGEDALLFRLGSPAVRENQRPAPTKGSS